MMQPGKIYFEAGFETVKGYSDPFNDVEVDVVFSDGLKQWRVPAFWHGENRWTVRFAPSEAGNFAYRVHCSDVSNDDLHGRTGSFTWHQVEQSNDLLRRGPVHVSANGRFFEHRDGTPFFWLADTWWTCLSDRLSWEGFQQLAADRKAKGFTVVQIVGGLIPSNEERAPSDPGFCNEGGAVWEPGFVRINPSYFDFADRRIHHLIEQQMIPAIVGGWRQMAIEMGETKLKQHWRYLIARYGCYPVLWIVGGEVFEPRTEDEANSLIQTTMETGRIWARIAAYIRQIDPYGHPVAGHELPPPYHGAFADASITDFEICQPHHIGWASLATEVADLTARYCREKVKPVVQGEIGYEGMGADHHQNFQRAAFWLAMLNGAAGHTYGAIEVAEAYSADKPLQRQKLSFYTWEEAMQFPGARQVSLNARLLRRYPWHLIEPHPEWVTPRGSALFEPTSDVRQVELDLLTLWFERCEALSETEIPEGEWKRRGATFRRPYAAGIPGQLRIIYIPMFGFNYGAQPPTILGLEAGVRYRAFYFDPSLGIRFDLGAVQRPAPGAVLLDQAIRPAGRGWDIDVLGSTHRVALAPGVKEQDIVAALEFDASDDALIALRFRGPGNFLSATYSRSERRIALQETIDGCAGPLLAATPSPAAKGRLLLRVEVRGSTGMLELQAGDQTVASQIVTLKASPSPGRVGATTGPGRQMRLKLNESPLLIDDGELDRSLYDAYGRYRGQLGGTPEWESWARSKDILLDAFRPEQYPYMSDWVLVLEEMTGSA